MSLLAAATHVSDHAHDRATRVLHLCAGNLFGGVETMLLAFARSSAADGVAHTFGVCFEGRLAAELRDLGADVAMLGAARLSRPLSVWRARGALRRLLREKSFDAVICHECWPHVLFASTVRRSGAAVVFWCHDAHAKFGLLERGAARAGADLIVANSDFTSTAACRMFPSAPCEVIHCAVRPQEIDDPATVRARKRQELNTSIDSVVIVMASRLEAWKGHTLLLDALSRLRDEPRWTCWIAGGAQRAHEFEYLKALQARAASASLANRVRFLGQRADVRDLLAAADIHCQPNLGPEPFGITFIEALYASLPVVTTALGGALEIVTDACGVLVPPADPGALAAALRDLIEKHESRRRLATAGPGRASQLCDPARQVGKLRSLFATRLRAPLGVRRP